MTKFWVLMVLGCLLSFSVRATVFVPTTLENLIKESSAVAEVVLASKQVIQNEMGIIQTVHSFEVLESSGLEVEMSQSKYISVTMIGGTLNGLTSYVEGAPEFEVGEKSFLLLKKIEDRLYLSNFSMGKYLIKEVDGNKYYESTVFPQDKEIGKVKKEKMLGMFKTIKSLVEVPKANSDKLSVMIPKDASVYSFSQEDNSVRTPANNAEESKPITLMAFFIFGWLMVMGYVFYPKKSGR